ncbi:hypothetical protein [Ureibacillus sp. GCM10028918]|uniref:hypothetical protein n=1 Tax=Ureibacillus sp. GCM10028918 TaxID=3273429 RepID=UPI003614561A
MRNLYSILFLCFAGLILVACSIDDDNDDKYLTRVDILVVNDEAMEEEDMIVDLVTLDSIKSLLEEIRWEPKSKPEITGSEDFVATLFYTINEDRQDQLYLYRMWINSDNSLSIISNNEDEGYGTLNEENADKLKNLFESYL